MSTSKNVTSTLRAQEHGHQPVVCFEPKSMLAENWAETDCKNALRADANKSSHVIVQDDAVYCLQANGIDRADTADCNGCGWRENESYTLNTIDRHGVCYQNPVVYESNAYANYREGYGCIRASGGDVDPGSEMLAVFDARGNGDGNTSPCLTGDHQNRVTDYTAVCVGNGQMCNIPPLFIIRSCFAAHLQKRH